MVTDRFVRNVLFALTFIAGGFVVVFVLLTGFVIAYAYIWPSVTVKLPNVWLSPSELVFTPVTIHSNVPLAKPVTLKEA